MPSSSTALRHNKPITKGQQSIFGTVVWRIVFVVVIGMLSVFVMSARPQGASATAMSTTWSCAENVHGGSRGRLYQSVSGGGSLSLYSYSGGSGGTWDLDLQATFSLPAGKTINALSLTPSGQMFGVLQTDGNAADRAHELVRLYPPSSVGGTGTYQVVGAYQHRNRTDKSVNAGSYIEIGGEGHLLMSHNGGGTNAVLYKLSTQEWFDYDMNGQGVVKDLTWLPEPVTYDSVTYIGVGIEENNSNQTVLYGADGSATAINTSLSGITFDSSEGWGAAASYEATGSTSSAVLLVRNDGILAEWEWNNGSPSLTAVGSATSTNDNDGAACGSTSLTTTITSVDTWGPTVGFELDCNNDALDITITNSGSTLDGEVNITKNDAELTWNENGYPIINAGATQTWSAAVTQAETGAVYAVTVNPPFGSGFDAATNSFTYDADCVQSPGTISCTSSSTGFIQAIKGLEGDDIVSFKLLSLAAGNYVDMDPAVSLDLAAIGFAGSDGFNATAIDKATGKMFATINNGADLWLVQFDLEPTPNIAFLGKVQHPDTQGGFSGTVTSDGTYVMNYYIDGLVEIPNVSSLTTYATAQDASGVLLGTVHNTSLLGWHGDLASITLSDNSEHVVGYNPGTNKVVLAPVDDLSNPVAYTTTFPDSFSTSGENLGASWSTDDTVYFSRNDGEGVFAVSAADINTETQSLTMRATSITSTETTSSNDGFGCVPAAEAPEVVYPASPTVLECSAWAGLIWVQNQGDTSSNDYQAANTAQFFLFDPATGTLDADGLDDASTWVYDQAVLGYDIAINATGVDPNTNIMYGTAKIGDIRYVASFAPGENPVFYAKNRETTSGGVLDGFGVGAVDADGYYWIKSGTNMYRSQQPLSAYEGFADYNDVTDPMVFDTIGALNLASDVAVIPTEDGYLIAAAHENAVHWGTWNSTTDAWTPGATVWGLATGSGLDDYGAAFVDGVSAGGDYSNASIYFMPNAGWDPDNAAGRLPIKLAVADALDGITADDLVKLEATDTPPTSSNDGSSMSGCGLQLPDPLGGLHGWMWADVDGDGSRTAVEPTGGMFGDEAVITGYSATVISETDWTTLQGVVAVPAGTRYPATVDADGKWSVDGLAAGADPTGVVQTFKVEFDYTGAVMPADFTPDGYTVQGGTTDTDSDVPVTAGATGTSIGGFTVTADTSTHAADAGITTPLPDIPPLPVTFDEQGGTDVDDLTCSSGGTFQVPAAPTRDGYTFAGWNSAADGTGTSYVADTDYNCAELTIYALWTQNPVPVTFDEQGGTDVDDLTCSSGGTFQVPAAPTRDGYTFAGWNSAADGTGTTYTADTNYNCAELTIYALWTQNPPDPTTSTTVPPETTTTTVPPETTTTVTPETTSTTVPVLLPATGNESRLVPMLVLLMSIGAGLLLMRRRVGDNE